MGNPIVSFGTVLYAYTVIQVFLILSVWMLYSIFRKKRTLPLHREHEVLLKLEKAGLDENLSQKIIESKENKLAKLMIASVSNGVGLVTHIVTNAFDVSWFKKMTVWKSGSKGTYLELTEADITIRDFRSLVLSRIRKVPPFSGSVMTVTLKTHMTDHDIFKELGERIIYLLDEGVAIIRGIIDENAVPPDGEWTLIYIQLDKEDEKSVTPIEIYRNGDLHGLRLYVLKIGDRHPDALWHIGCRVLVRVDG